LVEGEPEVFPVRSGDLEDIRRLAGHRLLAGRGDLELVALEGHERDGNNLDIDHPLLASETVGIEVGQIVAEVAPSLVAGADRLPATEVSGDFGSVVVEPLHGYLGIELVLVVHESDRSLGLPGDDRRFGKLLFAASRLNRLVDYGLRVLRAGRADEGEKQRE